MGGQTATQTSKNRNTGRREERSQASARHITASGPLADMLDLQHAVGNRAVSELVQSSYTASRGRDVPPIVRAVLKTTGQPLDPATRAGMESRFSHDFSQVRVHTDTRAAESAQAVSARAFTVGRDIVFAKGQYQPSLEQGRKLLAHELTHTIQQSSGASAGVALQNLITVEPADTALERTAEESASRLTTSSGALASSHGIALQRAPADEPPLFAVFVADERKRKDKSYARSLGKADAARIRQSGTLSLEDRQEVNAKLRFFEGEAWEAYIQEIRPALAQVTQPEIDMSPEPQQAESVAKAPEKRISPASEWVQMTAEELGGSSRGKVLLKYIARVARLELLKQWALELKAIHHTKSGNYLLRFFEELQDFNPPAAKMFTKMLAEKGVMVEEIALEWELHKLVAEEQSRPMKVRLENYPIYDWKAVLGQPAKMLVEAVNIVIHFVPVLGQALGGVEAIYGKEILTGRKLEGWERFLGLLPYAGTIMKAGKSGARAILAIARQTGISTDAAFLLVKNTSHLSSEVDGLREIKRIVDLGGQPSADQLRTLKAAHDSLKPLEKEVGGVAGQATQRAATPPQAGSYTVATSGGVVRYPPPKARVGAQATPQKGLTPSEQRPAQVPPPKPVVPAPPAPRRQPPRASTQRETAEAAAQKPPPAGEKPPPTRAEKPPASTGSAPKTPILRPPAAAGTATPLADEAVRRLIADRVKLGLAVDPREIEIVDRLTFRQAYKNAGWDGQGDLPAGFADPTPIQTGRMVGQPSGRIWILRGHDDPRSIFHEAVHSFSIKARAREEFIQRFGYFLEEGITESLTRKCFGPRAAAHPYDPHVAFVRRLPSRLGISEERLTRAYLDGDIGGLMMAIRQGLGGDGALTGAFLAALRNVGTMADNPQALRDAIYIMMTRRRPPAP